MAPSDAVINLLGALGGGVLAACLAPQIWKLYSTRSARDLSYLFCWMYTAGLIFSFVYLYFEDALVAWVCVAIELAFGLLMVAAKWYLDNYGPHSQRAAKQAHPQARLTNSASFAAEVRIDVQDIATGGKTAPFPLLHPGPGHAAQHLLLDCRLALPEAASAGATAAAAGAAGAAARPGAKRGSLPTVAPQGVEGPDIDSYGKLADDLKAAAAAAPAAVAVASDQPAAAAGVLDTVAGMLTAALVAAGLPVLRRQYQAFPSFRRKQQPSSSGGGQAAAAAGDTAPDMLFFSCREGYCTAVWYCSTATLSLDFLATSDATVLRMAEAAQQLCQQLEEEYPGTAIAASSVARMPCQ